MRNLAVIKLGVAGIVVLLVLSIWLVSPDRATASAFGPNPGLTNAPGESNCTDCHTGEPVNSGGGSVQILGLPHDYRPGQIIELQVKTSQKGATFYGFELTAIDNTGKTVGSFSVPKVMDPPTQIVFGTFGGGLREYVEHTSSGLFDPNVFGSNSWTFTWTAPPQRMGKVAFYAAGNAANGDGGPGGDLIYTTTTASLSGSAVSNFDGDFTSDVAVFRPRIGKWYSRSLGGPATQEYTFGSVGDKAVPGDYEGDGVTDLATYTPATSRWHVQKSSGGIINTVFGAVGDVPVQGDYDGDGKADLAVFRPATGAWTVQASSGGTITATLGQTGDKPAHADYDGDAKTDFAVFRPSDGTWYLQRSSAGPATIAFGSSTDRPVQADYDGDGRADLAYFRPSTATWYITGSTAGPIVRPFGTSTDIPSPADYDGDGSADVAVFQPGRKLAGGTFHVLRSSDLTTADVPFGRARDIPVASAYLAQ